jgi:DNA-binding transcriptional ArsR family regulator
MSKKFADLTKIFKALSDKSRLEILSRIYKGELKCKCDEEERRDATCIKDLSKSLNIALPTVSHHIKELINAGLITTRKEGRWVYCQINKKVLERACKFLSKFLKEQRYEKNS